MSNRVNMRPMSIIIAVDSDGGFGKDGKIPWNFPEDLKHFQKITKDGICIMGRNTYEDMYNMVIQRRKKKSKKKENSKTVSHIPRKPILTKPRFATRNRG